MTVLRYSQLMHVDNYAGLPATASVDQLAIDDTSHATFKFNGTTWEPLGRTTVKASSMIINGLVTGNYKIYTLEPAPMNFVPIDVIMTKVSQTGTMVNAPVISVGTNAPNYDNIANAGALNSILSLLTVGSGNPTKASTSPMLAPNTDIYAKVSGISVGPSVLTFNVDVIGYYKA